MMVNLDPDLFLIMIKAGLMIPKRHPPPTIYMLGLTTATRVKTQPRLILERLGYMELYQS